MTAEWKKSPLERAKRRDDLKALQAKVKELESKLESAHVNSQYYTFNTTNRYIWQPLPKQK